MPLHLVLASSSPARAQLLKDAGFSFTVDPAHLDEESFVADTHALLVQRLAKEKASVVKARHLQEEGFVLAADTLVIGDVNGTATVFGKPKDSAHAMHMLQALQGKTHHVLTGLCLMATNTEDYSLGYDITQVTFKPLSDTEITAYIATEEPFGKSGGYAIQGIARQHLVATIEGDESNVVGLPLHLLFNFLNEHHSASK